MLRLLTILLLTLPAAAVARDWQVNPAKSSLTFKGHYQNESFEGRFKKFDAVIHFDSANLANSNFDVTIDLASVDTQNDERDHSLKDTDFFNTAKFPKAHFVTESFATTAQGSTEAKGTLTLLNQSKPITLKVKFVEVGATATLDVDTIINRLDFKIGMGDWADTSLIGRDVVVHGHLVLTPSNTH